jgi:hypothetical protein
VVVTSSAGEVVEIADPRGRALGVPVDLQGLPCCGGVLLENVEPEVRRCAGLAHDPGPEVAAADAHLQDSVALQDEVEGAAEAGQVGRRLVHLAVKVGDQVAGLQRPVARLAALPLGAPTVREVPLARTGTGSLHDIGQLPAGPDDALLDGVLERMRARSERCAHDCLLTFSEQS